jgi:transposase InsO family protein
MRPEYANHVWSWDFVMERTHDGRVLKILVLIDEFTRRCLALHVARQIRSNDVIDILAEAMVAYGVPAYLRSDNGPEMVAKNLRRWLASVGSKTLYIEPGSPGRTDTANPSTANSGMNCSMEKSSTPSEKLRSSLSDGVISTIPFGRTAH